MNVIKKIAPSKQIRIKDNNEDLFKREVIDFMFRKNCF